MLVEVIPWIDGWFQVIYSKTTKDGMLKTLTNIHKDTLKISDASLKFMCS